MENSGSAEIAVVGNEGIGLYRTEYSFLLSDTLPGEDDQRARYREVLAAFAPRPVTLRTLDVGGRLSKNGGRRTYVESSSQR